MTILYIVRYSIIYRITIFFSIIIMFQNCSMYFILTSAASSYTVLEPFLVKYLGERDLIEYTIGKIVFQFYLIISLVIIL